MCKSINPFLPIILVFVILLACVIIYVTKNVIKMNESALTPASDLEQFTVGQMEIIITKASRDSKSLSYWTDGCMGVTRNGNDYSFYAANGSTCAKTTGQLNDIANTVNYASQSISNLKKPYNYASGGPIYKDISTGNLLMFYHAEMHSAGDPKRFYSSLGMAKSTNGGSTFVDLGEIISANIAYDAQNCPGIVEMTGTPYAIKDEYFYVYFRDYLKDGVTQNNLAVARAPVTDVLNAASQGNAPIFYKYYNGSFSQPGLGGASSQLEKGNPSTRWMDVSYNTYLNKYIMVVSQHANMPHGPDLYIATSTDGITWGNRVQIENEAGESFYTSLVGIGSDPKTLGQSFYVYYTFSAQGEWNRWTDADVVRRLITIN